MAKLIIEINECRTGSVCGVEIKMSHEIKPKGERQLSDATAVSLGEAVKMILPDITAALVEANEGRKVTRTTLHQDQSLAEVMANSPAQSTKTH